jgi:hypothetical protein
MTFQIVNGSKQGRGNLLFLKAESRKIKKKLNAFAACLRGLPNSGFSRYNDSE